MNSRDANKILSFGNCETDNICCRARGYKEGLIAKEVKAIVNELISLKNALISNRRSFENSDRCKRIERKILKYYESIKGEK